MSLVCGIVYSMSTKPPIYLGLVFWSTPTYICTIVLNRGLCMSVLCSLVLNVVQPLIRVHCFMITAGGFLTSPTTDNKAKQPS